MQRSTKNVSRVVQWGGIAGMLGGAAYVAKVAVIFAIDPNSPVIGPLYFMGALIPLFAAPGVAAKYASKLPTRIGLGVGVGVLHLMFIMGLSEGIEIAVVALTDLGPIYAQEIPLALLGFAWLIVGYRLWLAPTSRRMTLPQPA